MYKSLLCVTFTLFFIYTSYAQEEKVDTRPNIILITPNRLGADQLKQYGGLKHKTPNLDYLADNGITFYYFLARFNTSASWRGIVTGVSDAEKGSVQRWFSLSHLDYPLIKELNDAGYETGFVGKWRWGGNLGSTAQDLLRIISGLNHNNYSPLTAEFKHYWGFAAQTGPRADPVYNHIEMPNNPYYDKGEGIFYSSTLSTKGLNDKYNPHNSVKYIEKIVEYSKKKRKPFYIWWAMIYMYTHSDSWYPATPDYKATSNQDQIYYANLRYMDKMIGRLIKILKTHKILDNTVILFASISGTPQRHPATKGVKGIYRGKVSYGTNLYAKERNAFHEEHKLEQSYRTPFIAFWPRYIKEKKVDASLISLEDLQITIAKLAHAKGINTYINKKPSYKSYSFVPILKGHKNKGEKRIAIYRFLSPRVTYRHDISANYIFAQNRSYKLYANGDYYHIANDPEEKKKIKRLTPLEKAIKKQLQYFIDINPSQRPDNNLDGTTNPP